MGEEILAPVATFDGNHQHQMCANAQGIEFDVTR